MKSITIFCGSSPGYNEVFMTQAFLAGEALAKKKIRLVYGGANVGLMGAVADGVLSGGGEVTGVLPHFLQAKELAHQHLTELILVDSMHERKLKMNELCDGVIALPGGYGTLEELFEMLTWAQLGLHQKPTGLLNTNGFYDSLTEMIKTMVSNGFLKQANMDMLLIADNIDELLDKMQSYKAPDVSKWISPAKT